MVSFNIILRNDTVVLYSGLVQKVGGVSLLKKRITDVFFITKDFVNGARPPFCFAGAGENTISFKSFCNFIHVEEDNSSTKNAASSDNLYVQNICNSYKQENKYLAADTFKANFTG